MRLIFTGFLFILGLQISTAQDKEIRNEYPVFLFNISYGYHIPVSDLADRFDNSYSVGIGTEFMTKSTNWIFGIQGSFQFGNKVNEDPIANLRTSDGFVIGNAKGFADISLKERGWYLGGHIGKLWTLSDRNKRNGIRTTIGLGLMQHKIRIQDDPSNFVNGLDDLYKKGYDRLTNGLALREFIGYQYMATNRQINFYAGLEFTQGFTQNRRSYNYDQGQADTESRFDGRVGIRVGWTLPIYLGDGEDTFY